MDISQLSPEIVWKFFADICKIPRPSGHEQDVAEYIRHFAETRGFHYEKDAVGNVLVRKDGKKPIIALQSHMDMVCEKNKNVVHDFLKDPIKVVTDGNFVTADGTTLGADDGIGLSFILAALETSDRALECLFTVEEETSLRGAMQFESGLLEAKELINLDSGCEKEMLVGCAGGCTVRMTFASERKPTTASMFAVELSIRGLLGGHSGEDIDKKRANAVKLLAEFISRLSKTVDVSLCSFSGGGLSNAIAREADAIIVFPSDNKEKVRVEWNIFQSEVESIYGSEEKSLRMDLQSCSLPETCYVKSLSDNIISFLSECPHGVMEYSEHISGMVDGSCNLASVKESADGNIVVVNSQRHSDNEKLADITSRVVELAKHYGASVEVLGSYPGWKPNFESSLVRKAVSAYEHELGFKPKVTAIHAGLECGCFKSKYPDLEMISIGPDMWGIHSPEERLSVASVGNIWKVLQYLLG